MAMKTKKKKKSRKKHGIKSAFDAFAEGMRLASQGMSLVL